MPTAAAAADKPPPRRALNRIEQPASGRSPFQASATACPPRAGASPAKAANSSIPFSRILNVGVRAHHPPPPSSSIFKDAMKFKHLQVPERIVSHPLRQPVAYFENLVVVLPPPWRAVHFHE